MSYEIKKLLPRHIQVMDLAIAGHKQTEIAKRLKLSRQAVSAIINSEVFQDRLPKRRLELQQAAASSPVDECEQVAGVLQQGAQAAAKQLVELLHSEDERVRLAAAIAILDRAGYAKQLRAKCMLESKTVVIDSENAWAIYETLMMLETRQMS